MKPKQLEAAKLLARGLSVEAVAQTISVDRSTVHRWLKDRDFQALVEAEAAKAIEQLEAELIKLDNRALFALSQVIDRLEQLAQLAHAKVRSSQSDEAAKWALVAARVEQVLSSIALKRFADWGKRKSFEETHFGDWVAALQLGELDSFEGDQDEQP